MGRPSRAEREAQANLQRQQAAAIETQNRLLSRAEAPDPLAERFRQSRINWLDATEGRNGPVDVTRLEGMAPYLDLYNRARARREGERMGVGVLQMGVNASNPELAARIKEQQDTEREQAAAGGLENAYRIKDAEVRESVLPLAGLQQNRDLGLASLASNNANSAQDRYLQYLTRPRRPGFFSQFLQTGAQVGLQAAASAL